MLDISHLDHLVLTVADIQRSLDFYTALGFQEITFGNQRKALLFGRQKINLHQKSEEISPHARLPVCGSADLCFIIETPLEEAVRYLNRQNIPLESDIVTRTGATGNIRSIYLRDPDGNLIELSNIE
ncbi:VOC family protein [Caviibacterium pharyngocola]|uniref:Glyoxalase n=1 Tax=Caviibacterium pharyngocola TaxID=28159 RepID=A0A2M8RVD1_9PAST|nr:VOC family protein [Caviibacterium pharyngocola]PJG82849.1 glyoxalase [Caviibacterium pharyngocola]